MKNDRLSRCLGDIDEKFIDEAADYKKKGRKRGVYYLAAALAACILIVVAAQVRPSGVAEPRPATESPGPGSIAASPDAGVYIPAVELPETQNGLAMDMIACVVYNGAVYTQGAWLEDASALLGEYLGRATGGIDEWSDESEYSVEFAGTVAGELYAVKGYDTIFRICCLNDDGSALLLERLNGITLDTGADLFETRLHLPERLEALSFLTHEDWNKAAKNYRTPELSEETISAFLDELCAGQFVYTWESERGIYDSAVQGHLVCALSDGTYHTQAVTLEEVDEALPDWIEARNLARNLISPDGEPDWTAPESIKDYAASPAAVQRLIDLTDYGFYVHTVEDGTNVFTPWP